MSVNVNIKSILEPNELTRPNFLNWLRNIKIVLRSKKILYILDKAATKLPLSVAPINLLRHITGIRMMRRWLYV